MKKDNDLNPSDKKDLDAYFFRKKRDLIKKKYIKKGKKTLKEIKEKNNLMIPVKKPVKKIKNHLIKYLEPNTFIATPLSVGMFSRDILG